MNNATFLGTSQNNQKCPDFSVCDCFVIYLAGLPASIRRKFSWPHIQEDQAVVFKCTEDLVILLTPHIFGSFFITQFLNIIVRQNVLEI